MKIYKFGDRATEALKSTLFDQIVDQARTELEKSGADQTTITAVLDNLEDTICIQRSNILNFEKVNKDLFLAFLNEFPCYSTYNLPACIEQIYDDYIRDHLTDEQDVVFEFLLDLLSPYDSEFIFSDCFHLLDHENRQALLSTLSLYDEYLSNYHAY